MLAVRGTQSRRRRRDRDAIDAVVMGQTLFNLRKAKEGWLKFTLDILTFGINLVVGQ